MTGQVEVHVDLDGSPVRVGTLYVSGRRTLTSTFAYESSYLADPRARALEPRMSLAGVKHTSAGLPGCVTDAAPDRWGRNLIRKRLHTTGGLDGRDVTELDFLLGVSDRTRQGALHFSRGGPFLAEHGEVPKLVGLPQLLRASEKVAREDEGIHEIKLLLDAGSASLGGARPKASVQDSGTLCIAKFPHPADRWDVMAWEAVALDLAARAGVVVPAHRLLAVDHRGVLVLDRFDRRDGERVGYISAMTLLGASDGDQRDYIEIAEALAAVSADPATDLAQLWRRLAVGILVNNTDDHLRNHGLLWTARGWRLSPAFDINPNPEGFSHATTIGGEDSGQAALDALMTVADQFGLSGDEAAGVLTEVRTALADWASVAADHGITERERARFQDAFALVRA